MGYSLTGRKQWDTTDPLNTHRGGVNSGCNGGGEGGDGVGDSGGNSAAGDRGSIF